MKRSLYLPVIIILFLAGCRRDNPTNSDCLISQAALDGTPAINLSYDAQGRVTQVQFIEDPEMNFSITYTANQKITESPASSPLYEKKVYSYDDAGKVTSIKTYYEFGSPAANEERRYTYSGNQIIADTLYSGGSILGITRYTWQNGNLVKLETDGGYIMHRGYDVTRQPIKGDLAWLMSEIENTYYPPTANLITSEYIQGSGSAASGSCNYVFDNTGKVTAFDLGDTGHVTYTYQCN